MQRKQGNWTLRLAVIGVVMLITGFFLTSGTAGMLGDVFGHIDDSNEDTKKEQCKDDVRRYCEKYPNDKNWGSVHTSCQKYRDIADPTNDTNCANNN